MKRKRGPLLKDVDALFSRYVRLRDGGCVSVNVDDSWGVGRVECNGGLQAAHVISRRYHGTRYDPQNCWSLCQAHHLYETHHPLEGQVFWNDLLGGDVFEGLRQKAMAHRGKLDLKAIAAELREKIATLEIDAEPAA